MKPLLVTGNGTGVPDPFGPGFSTDIGRAFGRDPWQSLAARISGVHYDIPLVWQPIGYPAAVFPMGDSVAAGRAEVVHQIQRHEQLDSPPGAPLFLSGYSQFAIVTDDVWEHDILNPAGVLHHRLPDVQAGGIINFGDPRRCPGIANGNRVAGLPTPTRLDGYITGGIAGSGNLRPQQTPDFLLSCALDGDLYACAPTGDQPWVTKTQVGADEQLVYDMVQEFDGDDIMALVERVSAFMDQPIAWIIGLVQAIINGLTFAVAGPAAPHWQYGPFVPAMAGWIRERIAAASTVAA